MKCPFCTNDDTQVIDTRLSDDKMVVKRRRRCLSCERRFNTFEKIEWQMPTIVKTDGSRQEYAETKIRASFMKALHKRPVAATQVDQAIEVLRQQLLSYGEREVSSRIIGEMVMQQLAHLDTVAYIRFASIYRSFQDVADFTNIIKQVDEK